MGWLWLLLCALTMACAQPPTKEIELTAARLARAQEVEAGTYAEEDYVAAETALDEARQSLAHGEYRSAVESASRASISADEAYARAILRKRRMTRQAKRQLQEIALILEEAGSVRTRSDENLPELSERLRQLEEELEQGSAAEVCQKGLELKDDSLVVLRHLKPLRPH
jgi:hypothetical protein